MTLSRLRPKVLLALASLAPIAAATPAAADFFFRPFGYAFHRPIPETAPDASPRAIAEILGEEGFRLVGGLGRRGDQVVATGVDRRGRYRRFLIDPYEGEILKSWRVGPEVVHEAPGFIDAPPAAYRGAPPVETHDAPRTGAVQDPLVVPGLGAEPRRPAPQSAASPRRTETPGRTHAAARPEGAETQRIPHAPPSQATKPPARPTQSAAPHGSEKPASPRPAAETPEERKAQPQPQSAPTPVAAPAPQAAPAPATEPKAPAPSQDAAPHAAAPVPEPSAIVGHQQAAPAPQAAPVNPVSAEQSKTPPTPEAPKPTPGG